MSTTPPNIPLKKFLKLVKIPEIVFVIGSKKLLILFQRLLNVSSPKRPNETKFNIPPRPDTTASEKLPVS